METYRESFALPSRLKIAGNQWGLSHGNKSPPKRDTFRHGNLPEALVNAALERLEAEGVESISLRELARDAGVNHRAVYRHFPGQIVVTGAGAETGWKRLGQRLNKSTAGKAPANPRSSQAVSDFSCLRGTAESFH